MNWLRKLLIFSVVLHALGCGVKGDPLPPERPADLGRGRPTYKRATEKIKIESARPVPEKDEEEEDERDSE